MPNQMNMSNPKRLEEDIKNQDDIVEMARLGFHRKSLVAGLKKAVECLDGVQSGRDKSTVLITVRKYQLDLMEYDERHPEKQVNTPLARAQAAHRARRADLRMVGS